VLEFINWLRLIATVLITNSHYATVWPTPALATGGLLGNIIFFAVSGFCLFGTKQGFWSWYKKRFFRIWPVMVAFTLVAALAGIDGYKIGNVDDAIRLLVFPTNYVFVVWILVLYVPFWFVNKLTERYAKAPLVALMLTAVLHLAVYLVFVDKGAYVIDDVSSPFILFLYFAAMMLGAVLKGRGNPVKCKAVLHVLGALGALALYFGSKIAIGKWDELLALQIVNQYTIYLALFMVFTLMMRAEKRLENLPSRVKSVAGLVAKLTLQVYIVQFVIISQFEHLAFPLNFVVITVLILAAAALLMLAERGIRTLSAKSAKASGGFDGKKKD
jgi:peptidoglycan/LPS O-acetylase OafA/YrhL